MSTTADYAAAKARRDARDQAAMTDARHDLHAYEAKRAEERTLRTVKCKDCPRSFTFKPGMGRPPVRCENCRKVPSRAKTSEGKALARVRSEPAMAELNQLHTPAGGAALTGATFGITAAVLDSALPDDRPKTDEASIIVTPRQFVLVLEGRIRALDREREMLGDLLALYQPIGGGGR